MAHKRIIQAPEDILWSKKGWKGITRSDILNASFVYHRYEDGSGKILKDRNGPTGLVSKEALDTRLKNHEAYEEPVYPANALPVDLALQSIGSVFEHKDFRTVRFAMKCVTPDGTHLEYAWDASKVPANVDAVAVIRGQLEQAGVVKA